jgi:MFS family permease
LRSALGRSFESLSVPNYRLYFAGQLVSLSGNWMQIVAEMWLILQLTGSGVAVGVTSALQFLPMLLFGAWGGLLADRLPKRRLLILTQALMAIPALALWGVTAAGVVTPALVFALVFARGTVNAVDNPTRQSFVMEMVGGDRIVNAVSLNSVLIHSARIVGPAGAGALIATVGVEPCFLVNALSFVAMIVALRAMEPAELSAAPRAEREPGAVRAGVAYVATNPSLAIPMAMMALVGTLGFNFQVILPLLANFTFEGGAGAYTLLAAAMAAGSVVGALAAGARGRVGPRLLVAAALGFGGLAAVAAAAPTLPLAAIALAPVGAASVTFAAGVNSSLQLGADPTMRGRVMALYSIVFLGSTPIGGPIAGWLSETASPRAALLLAAAAATTAALGAWFAYVRLWPELATKSRSQRERLAASPEPGPVGTGVEAEDSGGVVLRGGWGWRMAGGHPVAPQAGGPDEPDRLEGRGRLDVEADSVALLDRSHGRLAPTPGEGDEDRVPGSDSGDLGPDPGEPGRDQGEGADRPQPLKGDPPRALRRQARRRPGAGERPRHRLARARRSSEQDAHDRGDHPPAAGEREGDVVGVLVGGDHGHRSERRGDARDEQHRDPEQVAEQHR